MTHTGKTLLNYNHVVCVPAGVAEYCGWRPGLVLYFHQVGLNLGPQARWQVPLPSEPSHYLGKILNYSHYLLKNAIQRLSEEVAVC